MKMIVAGGRDVPAKRAIELVDEGFAWFPDRARVVEVVHGGASGIDSAAGWYFATHKRVTVFEAEWDVHGKAAGPIRNKEMADYADALLAIWDGKSKGTKNMIETAEKAGLEVYIHRYGGYHA
jgi:hypothetical protein